MRRTTLERSVPGLASRLDSWEALLSIPRSDQAFLRAWARVAAEVRALASSPADCSLLESGEGERFDSRLARFQRRYLLLAETAASDVLIRKLRNGSGFRSLLSSSFARNTFDRLTEAPDLVELGACRRAVVVGCGPFPAAALFLHEYTPNAWITAVEIDAAAAGRARRVAELSGAKRVEIIHGDGCDHDYGGANVVYVVNQVTPKQEVLRRIASTAPPTVQVLVRDPFGPGRLLADSVDRSLPSPWCITATGEPDLNFFSRHLQLGSTR